MIKHATLDAFLTRRGADRRLARLTHDIALPLASGLEFGASSNPLPLAPGHTVEYVDYARGEATEGPDRVRVDHVWTGAGSFATICDNKIYDFAVAAQVAQYVPNLLGWFRGIFDVLRVGGVLNLSLPDRRFMFDVKRRPSTLGELIEAYYLDYARPSPRQLFDHTYGAAAIEPAQLWAAELDEKSIPRFSGEYALELAHVQARETLQTGRYVTCHCWIFTPFSFLDLMEEATRLGLFPFVMSQFSATDPGDCEFFVCLRRDAEEDPEALKSKQLGAIAYLRDIAERRNLIARRLAER